MAETRAMRAQFACKLAYLACVLLRACIALFAYSRYTLEFLINVGLRLLIFIRFLPPLHLFGTLCLLNFANLRLTLDFELGAKIQFIANQM